jgi:feruloyl esterase
MKVPASSIGLPTTGAVVTAATVMPASGAGAQATGEYCLVAGAIHPVDPAAPNIEFNLALPTAWNSKIMMLGGGGYDGSIPDVSSSPMISPTPLQRGYAVFASDSGHEAIAFASADGSFGMNDEALHNFAGDALKKTRDAAIYLIDARYAVDGPRKSYFAGGSSGGREALEVTQRWPQDWDGVIALWPAWAAASLDLQFGRITRAFAKPGAYPDYAKRKVLYDTAMATCDALDGVADNLISNTAACNATFNPSTAMQKNGIPLRCAGGVDTGDSCLSDAQIAALNVYNTPITFDYPLASGETQYPGFNIWGADLGLSAADPGASLALGGSQPASPMPASSPSTSAPYMSIFWDQWVRYFVTRDPNYNSLTVDPQNPGALQSRISQLTGIQDKNDSNLSPFNAKGGKLLIMHGTADPLVSTRSTEQYYQRLQTTMGTSAVDKFVRFYETPGFGHGYGVAFIPQWDALTVLENWAEHATVPPPQIVTDVAGVPGRTRPLCEFPKWPKYNGSGDVNSASSFSCVLQ